MTMLLKRHCFTTADYLKMADVGILSEDDRVELIEGEIIEMAPIGRGHNSDVDRLNWHFVRGLGERAIVRVQGSIHLRDGSDPEPDLVILRPRPDFYAAVDAGPADVFLIIEVADSSLAYDRDFKIPLYARYGIPEAWLVDLNGKSITVYRDPSPDGYRQIITVRDDERLSPQAFPEFMLTASQILG